MPVLLSKTKSSKVILMNGKPSAFMCSGKEELSEDSSFLTLPSQFPQLSVEVRTFGGNGLSKSQAEYVFKTIEEFLHFQPDPEPRKQMLQYISEVEDEAAPLRISGAFSVLASLIQPMTLYRAMKRSPGILHQALERINAWLIDYASAALRAGVAIISFADPCGLCELVGKENFISFAAKYQCAFLTALEPQLTHSLIHICGKNSVDLERCGLIRSEKLASTQQSYGKEVLLRAQDESFAFCGHGCIVEGEAACRWIWKLTLTEQTF